MSKTREQNTAAVKRWREKHPERAKEQTRKSYYKQKDGRTVPYSRSNGYLLRKYGITTEQYEWMHLIQDGKCAICGSTGGKKSLHVDHDHATGKVRALLCTLCNTGLGSFGEDRYRLKQAIDYLSEHQG